MARTLARCGLLIPLSLSPRRPGGRLRPRRCTCDFLALSTEVLEGGTAPLTHPLAARSPSPPPRTVRPSSAQRPPRDPRPGPLEQEREKLKALKKSIEASKAHLAELEKSHGELEASIGGKQ